MGNKSRIRNLFKQSGDEDGHERTIRLYVLAFALVVVIAAALAVNAHRNKAGATANISNSPGVENLYYQEKIAALHERVEDIKMAALYARDIEIRSIKTSEIPEGGVFLKGEIKNRCRQGFQDIGLTIYGLDEKGRPIYQKDIVTHSSDGLPLTWHSRRKFSAVLDDAPREIRDYAVIVNSVDLVNVIIQERDSVF